MSEGKTIVREKRGRHLICYEIRKGLDTTTDFKVVNYVEKLYFSNL